MTELPTIRVKSGNPLGYAIINQSDYDASVHELYDDCSTDSDTTESEETPATDETEQPVRKRRERKSEVVE